MHIFEKEFDFVIQRAKSLDRPARMVVAGGDCENVLKAVFEAQAQGFGRPILVGNEDRITDMLLDLEFLRRLVNRAVNCGNKRMAESLI